MSEKYQMGYSDEWLRYMSERSIATQIGHIAHQVSPGMTILDVGCGPGSITVELAQLADPGAVIGVDMNDEQFVKARSLAEERGLQNVTFQTGNAYKLPFNDESFDIVNENAMLMHLAEPVQAISEMARVLKPGGLIALRDLYWSGSICEGAAPCPIEGGMQRMRSVIVETQRQHGADWNAGVKHRGRLKAVGFLDVDTGVSPIIFANDERWQYAEQQVGWRSNLLTQVFTQAIELKILTIEEVAQYKSWLETLHTDPAAVEIRMWLHTTGRKPHRQSVSVFGHLAT